MVPTTLVVKLCETKAQPRDLETWPDFFLRTGGLQPTPFKLFRRTLLEWFSVRRVLWDWFWARSHQSSFILRFHNGIKILAYLGDEAISPLILNGYYEPRELSFLQEVVEPGMTFIDVGAHMGLYSLFASRLVGEQGTVIAIEPSEREFLRLQANLKLNGVLNVRPKQVAVLDHQGEARLLVAAQECSGQNTLGQFIHESTTLDRRQVVRTERLDDIVMQEKLNRVDVIKMDIEGAEFFALQGVFNTLEKFHPLLLLELSDRTLAGQGCASGQVWNLLISLGYHIYLFDQRDVLPIPAQKKSYFEGENIIAIHETSEVKGCLQSHDFPRLEKGKSSF